MKHDGGKLVSVQLHGVLWVSLHASKYKKKNKTHLSPTCQSSCNLESFLPSVRAELMRADGGPHFSGERALSGIPRYHRGWGWGAGGMGWDGMGASCVHVQSFQIKDRYQRVVFVVVLDCVIISLNRFSVFPKEAARAHPQSGGVAPRLRHYSPAARAVFVSACISDVVSLIKSAQGGCGN